MNKVTERTVSKVTEHTVNGSIADALLQLLQDVPRRIPSDKNARQLQATNSIELKGDMSV